MNPIHILKAPIEDISNCKNIIEDMKKDKKAFESNEINSAILESRKQANLIKFCTVSAPLVLTTLTVSLFGSLELYEAYKSDTPFNEYFGTGFEKIKEMADRNFENDGSNSLIEALSSKDPEDVKEYFDYLTTGIWGFLKEGVDHFLNNIFLLSAAAIYGVTNAGMKALGFLTGETNLLTKYRMNKQEEAKLSILRKYHHDPVFDNLNNEELFAMSLTFNEIIKKNYNNKKKILKPVIKAIDRFTLILKPLRMAFNKSTNDKKALMTNVFDYLDSDMDYQDLASSLKKYNISNNEFNSMADRNGILTEDEKFQYLSKLNKRAMISAYRRKTKDDMILSFSLVLESFVKKEVDLDDKEFENNLDSFMDFVKMYTKENRILQREKLPEELRIMLKITKSLRSKKQEGIREIMSFKENYSYIDFLKKHAKHLVEEKGINSEERKVFLNNYSFVSYYEAERKRIAKLDLINEKIYENTKSLYRHSSTRNRFDYKKKELMIEKLTKDAIKHHDIFFDNNSLLAEDFKEEIEDIFKPEITKISSIYKDEKINCKVIVRNLLTFKEKEFLIGRKALKEKGVCIENAKRVRDIRTEIDSSTKKYNKNISRTSFKVRDKKFR